MIRTFRYPLRPTKVQEATLTVWLGQCCDLYNAALQERRDAWQKQRKQVRLYDQHRELTEWRAMDSDAAAVPLKVQRSALDRVDRALKAFFRRCKAGGKPGYPRFKSKRRYDSFSVPGYPDSRVAGGKIELPKLGAVRFHEYRPLHGVVKRATIGRDGSGRWWVSFASDLGNAPEKVAPRTIVGVDLGLSSLVTLSTGEKLACPHHGARAADRIARAQRILSRRKKGSKSRERARARVAKEWAVVRNRRLDFARKTAKAIVQRFDCVVVEDLRIDDLVRGQLHKPIVDAGWGILLHCIACKAEEAGKHVVAVDPRGTSQRCSGCGGTVQKALRERVHDCPFCGLVIDRDENAAINICALGRSAVFNQGAFGPTETRNG